MASRRAHRSRRVRLHPGSARELLFDFDSTGARVIPVIDAGDAGKTWALVMPTADESLDDLLRQRQAPMSIDETVRILTDIATGLVELGSGH